MRTSNLHIIVTVSITGYHKYHPQLNLSRQGRGSVTPIWLPSAGTPGKQADCSYRGELSPRGQALPLERTDL